MRTQTGNQTCGLSSTVDENVRVREGQDIVNSLPALGQEVGKDRKK